MPWHSVDQLGQTLIAMRGLDWHYCAGETLEFLLGANSVFFPGIALSDLS